MTWSLDPLSRKLQNGVPLTNWKAIHSTDIVEDIFSRPEPNPLPILTGQVVSNQCHLPQ